MMTGPATGPAEPEKMTMSYELPTDLADVPLWLRRHACGGAYTTLVEMADELTAHLDRMADEHARYVTVRLCGSTHQGVQCEGPHGHAGDHYGFGAGDVTWTTARAEADELAGKIIGGAW